MLPERYPATRYLAAGSSGPVSINHEKNDAKHLNKWQVDDVVCICVAGAYYVFPEIADLLCGVDPSVVGYVDAVLYDSCCCIASERGGGDVQHLGEFGGCVSYLVVEGWEFVDHCCWGLLGLLLIVFDEFGNLGEFSSAYPVACELGG